MQELLYLKIEEEKKININPIKDLIQTTKIIKSSLEKNKPTYGKKTKS